MTLRTRLVVAFFAISVIPLSAVTLFSYFSSERALRRAAEQQAASTAAELGRRMEWVTTDVERRMDRVWPMPAEQRVATAEQPVASAPASPAPRQKRLPRHAAPPGLPVPAAPAVAAAPPAPMSADVAGHLAGVLGDVAPMIESLEIMPRTKPPLPPGVPPPPGVPAAQAPHSHSPESKALEERAGKVVIQMSQVIDKAMQQYAAAGEQGQAGITAWSKAMQERLREAATAMPTQEEWKQLKERAKARQEAEQLKVETAAREGKAETAKSQGVVQDEQARTEAELAKAQQEAAGARHEAAGAAQKIAGTRQPSRGQQDADRVRAQQDADRARADRVRAVTQMKGSDLDSSVQRNGEEVGRIHARLNMPRVFRTILPARRDEGEVAFAIDSNGEIHAPDSDKATVTKLKTAGAIPAGGGTVRSGGDWVVVTRKGPGGMTFGTARPLGRDLADLRGVAARNFGVGFGLIALVFFGSVPLAGSMTRNLRTLMHGVQAVSRGDLSARVPVRSHDEFGRLAAAFNQMAAGLSEHEKLVVQQERLQRELELCRQIQTDMLPREPLRLGLAEVKGVSIPAREVGGDFFNYFVLPSGEIAVLVGDVSGKGVGAALLMANVQATLRARLPLEQDLARLAEQLDCDLYANTPAEVYLTMFVGIVNPETRVLRYVNAGHNTQFVLRREAGIDPMPSTGRPLGLLPGGGYVERSTQLPLGDLLFFYTDGIVEAENEAGQQFGMDRLEAALVGAAAPGSHVDDVLGRVEEAVRQFRGHAEPSDDATMMALRLGNGNVAA